LADAGLLILRIGVGVAMGLPGMARSRRRC
jgi:hypothetical protein